MTASVAADTHIRPSIEIIYKTTKREPVREDNDDDDDYENEFHEEDAKTFVRDIVGPIASPYLIPYVCKRRFLDTQAVHVRTVIYLRLVIPRC